MRKLIERVSIGGQAVIEGVMMRSPEWLATAVRKPSGEIVYKKTKVGGKRNKLAKIPFVRGAVTLFDALVLGIKELTFSANQSEEEEEKQLSQKEAVMTTVVSLGLGIGLFVVFPSLISSFVFADNRIYSNLLEAVLRLAFFVFYIWVISFSKDVKEYMNIMEQNINLFMLMKIKWSLHQKMQKDLQHYTQDVELVFY